MKLLATLAMWAIATLSALTSAEATLLTVSGEAFELGDPALPGGGPAGGFPRPAEEMSGMRRCLLREGPLAATSQTLHLELMVHIGPARQRDCRIMAFDERNRPRELARVPITTGSWQLVRTSFTIPNVALHDVSLMGAGPAPLIVSSAILAEEPPSVAQLELRPNPLLAVGYDGSKGLPQVGRQRWTAIPQPNPLVRIITPGTGSDAERAALTPMVNAIDTGWNTLPAARPRHEGPKAPDPEKRFVYKPLPAPCTPADLRFYADGRELGSVLSAAIADVPQIIIIYLTARQAPELRPEGLSKAMTAAVRQGTMISLVIDERPQEARIQKEWSAWIDSSRALEPALAIADLAIPAAWWKQPGAQVEAVDLLFDDGSARFAPLADAYAELRARLEWVYYDARDEVDFPASTGGGGSAPGGM
jgi:hypothetical protein